MAANLLGELWLSVLSSSTKLISSAEGESPLANSPIGVVFKLHSYVTFVFLLLASGILQITKVESLSFFGPRVSYNFFA